MPPLPETEPVAGTGLIPLPAGALAVPDEGEEMVSPEPGDRLTVQMDVTVESVQGDQVMVRPLAVNGQELKEPEPAEPESMAGLEGAAQDVGYL